MPHRSRPVVAALLAVAVALAGCGGPDPDPPAAPGGAPAAAPLLAPAAAGDDAAQVAALAEGWWATYRRIRADRERLAVAGRYLVDPYLADVEGEYRAFTHGSRSVRLSDRSALTVEDVRVDGDRAVVVTCAVDADRLLTRGTWHVVSTAVTTVRRRVEARRTPAGWRLAEHGTLAEAPGADCPPPRAAPASPARP